MEMAMSNHFLYADLVHHPIETTNYKWLFGTRFNWMIPNPYIENGCFAKHPFINAWPWGFPGNHGKNLCWKF